MHLVSENQLGIPQSSRDAFDLIHQKMIIPAELNRNLKAMVGFRNIAAHDYRSVQIPIVQSIIDNHLDDFHQFVALVRSLYKSENGSLG
jgi:uncharacterized protein YutE (UPF0331/DUF86 family)